MILVLIANSYQTPLSHYRIITLPHAFFTLKHEVLLILNLLVRQLHYKLYAVDAFK